MLSKHFKRGAVWAGAVAVSLCAGRICSWRFGYRRTGHPAADDTRGAPEWGARSAAGDRASDHWRL